MSFLLIYLFVVQNDHPAPTTHDTPEACGLGQTEAALLPRNHSQVCASCLPSDSPLQKKKKSCSSTPWKIRLFKEKDNLLYPVAQICSFKNP